MINLPNWISSKVIFYLLRPKISSNFLKNTILVEHNRFISTTSPWIACFNNGESVFDNCRKIRSYSYKPSFKAFRFVSNISPQKSDNNFKGTSQMKSLLNFSMNQNLLLSTIQKIGMLIPLQNCLEHQ